MQAANDQTYATSAACRYGRLLGAVLATWLLAWVVSAAPAEDPATARTPQVTVQLLAGQDAAIPGRTLWLGLHFELAPHWHLYWRNPGDSGEAPRVQWQLPDGWRAGDIHWPVPQRIRVGPLVNYGYEHAVTLLVPVSVPADRQSGQPLPPAEVSAEANWLVCREECIPQSATLHLSVPRVIAASPADDDRFAAVRAQWPLDLAGDATYRAAADGDLTLRVPNPVGPATRIGTAWFATDEWGPLDASAAPVWRVEGDDLLLDLAPGDAPLATGAPLRGLLVIEPPTGDATPAQGFFIDAMPENPDSAGQQRTTSSLTLAVALGLALLGGVLLNAMPCVLPVLSIKVLGLLQHGDRGGARHGLAFGAGVLASFVALAGLLLALRAGGAELGWGFQLQEPLVVGGLLYLMLALALNLSGVYTIGAGLAGFGQGLTERNGLGGSFATGVLAVVVASPCTAPFMGSALGFALTRPAGETLLVFTALALGFALPVVVFSLYPRWLRHLPAPGAWMERLRNALAFPLYATAAWLLWVLSQQVDAAVLGGVLSGAVLLAFSLWWYGAAAQHRRQAITAGLLGLVSVALLVSATMRPAPPDPSTAAHAEAWSVARVAALRAAGQPVLVNFTAAWCITCQVNERVALSRPAVQAALARIGGSHLKADWTRRDPDITAALQRHGRSGVPLYLLYSPGSDQPRVLPQLLTEGLLLDALGEIPPNPE